MGQPKAVINKCVRCISGLLGRCRRHSFGISSSPQAFLNVNDFANNTSFNIRKVLYIVTDMMNELPGNSSVNMVQHATIEEAVFSVDPTNAPIDCLDSDHLICLL
jgi:hypothetical protein